MDSERNSETKRKRYAATSNDEAKREKVYSRESKRECGTKEQKTIDRDGK